MCSIEPCHREPNEEKVLCSNERCKDRDGKPREVHLSCFKAQILVKEYVKKTNGTQRGRGTSMPFVDSVPMCPKCTKASVKEWVLETDDGKAYAKANAKPLTRAGVMFISSKK